MMTYEDQKIILVHSFNISGLGFQKAKSTHPGKIRLLPSVLKLGPQKPLVISENQSTVIFTP